MSLSDVSLLFLLQTCLGALVTCAISDREALGPKYFKFTGWVLVALLGLALWLVAPGGDRTLLSLIGLAAVATLLFASVSGWELRRLESALLVAALLAAVAAVVLSALLSGTGATAALRSVGGGAASPGWLAPGAHQALAGLSSPDTRTTLGILSALGSAGVLGFTVWGMILGHWYLVSAGLSVRHLERLVAPLPWILLAKACVSGLALWLFWPDVLGPGNRNLTDLVERSPTGVLDVVNVWTRIPIGLAIPAVLAAMTRVTVRMEKTQPATGILYAMCGLVISGELMGRMLEGGTGVPF